MKKRRIITILGCVFAMLFTYSCFDGLYEVFMRSMVSDYGIPAELVLAKTYQSRLIQVEFKTSGIAGKKSHPVLYNYWCQKHGDMSYNREETIHQSYEIYPHRFIAADYTAIEVTCDTDWDADHPAGTPLNDIMMFYAVSPIKYIRSGYTEMYDWDSNENSRYFKDYMLNHAVAYKGTVAQGVTPFYPIMKPVDELMPEDMILLGTGNLYSGNFGGTMCFLLEFRSLSAKTEDRTITVTVTTDKEETFSASIELTL